VSKEAILERERRYRRLVVAASILPLLLLLVAAGFQASASVESDLAPPTLRAVNDESGSLLLGTLISSFAFALLAVPLTYLFRAAQARTDRVPRSLVFLVALGPLVFAIGGILFTLGTIDAAEQFVDQETGVGDIYSLSRNLIEDSSLQSAAQVIQSIGVLLLMFGMIYVPLWCMRTGLLTRLHGTFGIALGASFFLAALFPSGLPTLPLTLAWVMYFGLVLAGRTPKGRPPAWDAGVAVPPPKPGEQPEPVVAAAGGDSVVEGDATEIPGVDENPNAARRERAKKRKRKRRR
jgi:hypothetical protein